MMYRRFRGTYTPRTTGGPAWPPSLKEHMCVYMYARNTWEELSVWWRTLREWHGARYSAALADALRSSSTSALEYQRNIQVSASLGNRAIVRHEGQWQFAANSYKRQFVDLTLVCDRALATPMIISGLKRAFSIRRDQWRSIIKQLGKWSTFYPISF